MAAKPIRGPIYGLTVIYSPVNLAYFICWCDQVVSIKSDRAEAIAIFDEWTAAALAAVAREEAREAANTL